MILPRTEYVEVPLMLGGFDLTFDTFVHTDRNGIEVLDFSQPGMHTYQASGLSFDFPAIPEDSSMEAYTSWYKPRSGDVVWDAGAHAGATTYAMSKLVGDSGRVYAFEPDEFSYQFLLKNIARHQLSNVVPVKKALSGSTGTAEFQMNGTMAAGIVDYLTYAHSGRRISVPTVSVQDACREFGCVPAYIKMDIEGAEVAVVKGALEFLASHPIEMAIESSHPIDCELTHHALDRLFPSIGYEVQSSNWWGTMFTFARRAGAEL